MIRLLCLIMAKFRVGTEGKSKGEKWGANTFVRLNWRCGEKRWLEEERGTDRIPPATMKLEASLEELHLPVLIEEKKCKTNSTMQGSMRSRTTGDVTTSCKCVFLQQYYYL